ncbi:MAG: sulfur carrier protein ThiS [Chthoniobacterales bacterium]
MQLKINGQLQELPEGINVPELLKELGLAPATVLVERNQIALLRSEWDETKLQNGDTIEILKVAAGG